jgi:uncharacterized membrane protein
MHKPRLFVSLAAFFLVTVSLSGILLIQVPAFAQTPEPSPTEEASPTPPPRLDLDCNFPAMAAEVGQTFSYDIDIRYYGTDKQTFSLVATPPAGWNSNILGAGKQISSVQVIGFSLDSPGIQTITVTFTPSYPGPPAGLYTGNVKVSNDTLTQTIELMATVVTKYNFALNWTDPNTGSTVTDVTMRGTPGKASDFPFQVSNTGSADIKNLTFSADAPKGWTVTFNPPNISQLGSLQTQQVDALVTPNSGSNVAGDYVLTLKGDDGTVSAKMILRISIPPSTTSVWVIVTVAAVIILVLVGAFQFLGKKKPKMVK